MSEEEDEEVNEIYIELGFYIEAKNKEDAIEEFIKKYDKNAS